MLFVVKTDKITMIYFTTQPNLSLKQARWNGFLVEFYMVIEYRLGKLNSISNTLSKKEQLEAIEEEEENMFTSSKSWILFFEEL